MDRSFFRFVINDAFDRQTEFSSLDRVCISFSAVKIRPREIKSIRASLDW